MSKNIAIVGAGTAGLQLGLYLLQNDVRPTLFTDRKPEEYRSSKLPNTVAHHAITIERERALGVDHWPELRFPTLTVHVGGGEEELSFVGDLGEPSRVLDYRIYHPRLLEDFEERGGEVIYREMSSETINALGEQFDLVVVCTGKGSVRDMFPRDEQRSPFCKPQRLLCAGLFSGVTPPAENTTLMTFVPGLGEVVEFPTFATFGGRVTGLFIQSVPGSEQEILTKQKYEDDPRAFLKLTREMLLKHHPAVGERIVEEEFDLADGPNDIIQGALVPTVRKSHIFLDDGTLALALGDLHVLNDPITGQGANIASHAAWVLGEEIVRQDLFDDLFAETVDMRRSERLFSATRWTNYMLAALASPEPPQELNRFIAAVSQNQALADEFIRNFNYPEEQWRCFATPERVDVWTQRFESHAS